MSQADMDAALDDIVQGNAIPDGEDDQNLQGVGNDDVEQHLQQAEQDADDNADDNQGDDQQQDDSPPGFMSHEEWIAAGKDPKDFRGENAYKAQYENLKENREFKDQIKNLEHTVKGIAEVNEEWRETQRDSMRAEITKELTTAKENDDVDAALLAAEKLTKLDQQTPRTPQTHPLIKRFYQDNPMTDEGSDSFNADYARDVQGFYNSLVDDLSARGTRQLTDDQVGRVLGVAKNKAKELHADLFESPRNQRQTTTKTPGRKGGQPQKGDHKAKLKGVSGLRNKKDTNPALDLYNELLKKDPSIAEAYANAVEGD